MLCSGIENKIQKLRSLLVTGDLQENGSDNAVVHVNPARFTTQPT